MFCYLFIAKFAAAHDRFSKFISSPKFREPCTPFHVQEWRRSATDAPAEDRCRESGHRRKQATERKGTADAKASFIAGMSRQQQAGAGSSSAQEQCSQEQGEHAEAGEACDDDPEVVGAAPVT